MGVFSLYATAFILTFCLEYPAARLSGLRGWDGAVIVLAVNLLTNPAAVFANLFLASPVIPFFSGTAGLIPRHLLIEAAVILTEALLYKEYAPDLPHPWRLSVIANCISYTAGMLLQRAAVW